MSDPSVDDQREAFEDEALSNPVYATPPSAGLMSADLDALVSMVNSLGVLLADGPIPGTSLADHARWLLTVRELRRDLADIEQLSADACGALMDSHTEIVDGLGAVTRHSRKSRTAWEKDPDTKRPTLLRVVEDLRVVDKTTGEVVPSLEKVLRVWNLAQPRTTVLREWGIDADQFCQTETKPGWSIEVKGAT